MSKVFHLSGVYVALPTPFGDQGRPEAGGLDPLLDDLLASGITGFCLGGVTGEYAVCDVEDRLQLFRHVARRVAQRVPLIFGVSAEHSRQVRRMAEVAADLGAVAVLLAPPAYFYFQPPDLAEIIPQVARNLPLPVLLYHIPQFASDLGIAGILQLVQAEGNIVGIKDSSGRRTTLKQLAAAKHATDFTLMNGSDDLFLTGLKLGADGCISGLSCIFPELILGIYRAFQERDDQRAAPLQQLVQDLATAAGELPTPWAVKIALRVEGYPLDSLTWPLSARLAARAEEFRQWFQKWAPLARERMPASNSSQHAKTTG
jgi:dihydrodipicolinate synthase/N-acetylneuraminate lyase